MIVAKFNRGNCCKVCGLCQWDYGQELVIENAGMVIPDGTEINFYQGDLSHMGVIRNNHVLIPDIMLQNSDDITAYVYVREATSGETVLSIVLYVLERPRPETYVLPEYKEYSRLLPPGGEMGQVLTKESNIDYSTIWQTPEKVELEPMTNAEIDAIFNNNI